MPLQFPNQRLVGLLGVVSLLIGPLLVPSPAAADTENDEQLFATLINELRAERGLEPLEIDRTLTGLAREWASVMATNNELGHGSNLANGVDAPWTVLGENVGVHRSHDVRGLFDTFVASPNHLDNLIDPRFDYLGVGVVYGSNGSLWTAHRFMAVDDNAETVVTTTTTVEPVEPLPETTTTTEGSDDRADDADSTPTTTTTTPARSDVSLDSGPGVTPTTAATVPSDRQSDTDAVHRSGLDTAAAPSGEPTGRARQAVASGATGAAVPVVPPAVELDPEILGQVLAALAAAGI